MNKKKFYKIASDKWGQNFILDMLIEESAEVIQAIQHFKRRKENSFTKVMEEIADTEIIIENFKVCLLNQISEYNSIKRKKINRAIVRLTKATAEGVKG